MLERVDIDERTWAEGSEARRLEWTASIREMLQPQEMTFREDATSLDVTMSQQATVLRARDAAGEMLCEVEIRHDELTDSIREYVDIVRQLSKASAQGGVARLEALDMAKKATHDKAGRFLKRRCREMKIDHVTARRLFTLIVGLRIDTTRLVGIHGHRTIR